MSKINKYPTFRIMKQLEEKGPNGELFLNQEWSKNEKGARRTNDINKIHKRTQELQDVETNKNISYSVEEYEVSPDLLSEEDHLKDCARNTQNTTFNFNARCSCKELSAKQEIKSEDWEQEVLKLMEKLKVSDKEKNKDKEIETLAEKLIEELNEIPSNRP